MVAVLAATFTTALAWAPTATAQAARSITSTPMTRVTDYRQGIPADYWWHSKVFNLQLDTTYQLRARCEFTAANGHTTAPGNVQYSVEFTLHST
ncbi:hypothetical protein ACLMAJ_16170 [Nocardia sp. KC 131]|uniref:hypothetical protein n=1 Tax=Nocardia arseniciresistens TaxID=3392119 RepID=UPI00398EA6C5